MPIFRKKGPQKDAAKMSFIDHLDELRKHLFRSVIAVVIGAVLIAYYNDFIIRHILMGPTHSDFATYVYLCKLGEKLGFANTLCLGEIHVKLQ